MRFQTLAILTLGVASAYAQGFNVNFTNGSIPSNVTVEDKDGASVPGPCYKNGRTTNGWMVSQVGETGNAAVSSSHTHTDVVQDNRLTVAAVKVPDGAVLRWTIRSIHPDFKDTYKIVAYENGSSNYTVLYDAEAPDVYVTRAVDVSNYAGKNISFGVICTSTHGYLLALKEFILEAPSKPLLVIDDKTVHFQGGGTHAYINGDIYNCGKQAKIASVEVRDGQKVLASSVINQNPKAGEVAEYSVYFSTAKDVPLSYTLVFKGEDGSVLHTTDASKLIVSDFTRCHFVDEGTGVWCQDCPKGYVALNKIHHMFGSQIEVVSDHTNNTNPSSDPFDNHEYWAGLKFFAAPYFMLNRNPDTKFSDTRKFVDEYFYEPTWVSLRLTKLNNGEIEIGFTPAKDIDNSTDRYRLSYFLTADFHCYETAATYNSKYAQKNSLTMPTYEEYYFLPATIPAHLMKYKAINIGGGTGNYFDGIPFSLPEKMKAGEEFVVEGFPVPEIDYPVVGVDQFWSNPKLIFYVLDTENDNKMMNCVALPLDSTNGDIVSGIESVSDNNTVSIRIYGHTLVLGGDTEATVSVYSMTGSTIWTGNASSEVELPESGGTPVIISVTTPDGNAVTKAIL